MIEAREPPIAWALSDGKAGHEAQTLGIAEALGLSPLLRRIEPRSFFAALAPFGPIDPRDASSRPESPIAPPYPDILIAAGRRTVPYLRRVRRASKGATLTVFVNDPRTGASTADVIVAPHHDALEGENVIRPLTPANRITAALLATARANPDLRIAALPGPRVAFLIGGNSRHFRFTDQDAARLAEIARTLVAEGASVMATMSRRTPPPVAGAMRAALEGSPSFLWDGTADKPLCLDAGECGCVHRHGRQRQHAGRSGGDRRSDPFFRAERRAFENNRLSCGAFSSRRNPALERRSGALELRASQFDCRHRGCDRAGLCEILRRPNERGERGRALQCGA